MKQTIPSLLLVLAVFVSVSCAADRPGEPASRPVAEPTARSASEPVAPPAADPLQEARKTLKADRQEVVAACLHLTDAEANDFWPIYHQYRTAMEMVGDGLIKLATDYAEAGSSLSEDDARQLMRDYLGLEKKYLETRTKYFKKVGEVLPATKALRFAQLENRLDLAIRLELAAHIPLAAPEKK